MSWQSIRWQQLSRSEGFTHNRTILFLILAPVISLLNVVTRAQDAGSGVQTNIQVFRSLSGRIGREVVQQSPQSDTGATVLAVYPREIGWLIEDSLSAALMSGGIRVSPAASAGTTTECGITEMSVKYSNPRRDGFLGRKTVDRTVALGIHIKCTDRKSGMMQATRDYRESSTDTIGLSDIGQVENPAYPFTRASVPAEGFFDTLAEPLIVLGAIGVAVYLLFSVRS